MGHIDKRRLGDQGLTFNFRFTGYFSPQARAFPVNEYWVFSHLLNRRF